MVLSPRLMAVAKYIYSGATVADIGTDHAYLPVYLIQQGITNRIIAGEINEQPFKAAQITIQANNIREAIDLRLGNGLNILTPGEAEIIVIAGMGGKTVCTILGQGSEVLKHVQRLVIQPMNNIPMVRRWLLANEWHLADEEMINESGHYYVIISAEQGNEKINDDFLLTIGPRLLEKKDTVLRTYLNERLLVINHIVKGINNNSGKKVTAERALFLQEQAAKIQEVLYKW